MKVKIDQLLGGCKDKAKKSFVIIGNGIAGITCARHIRKNSNDCITVISSETEYHFSRTALMYIYMGHMRFEDTKPYEDWFWTKNQIRLLNKHVASINTHEKHIVFSTNETIKYDTLIIASGSKSNKFGWPGQDLKGVQGLYNYKDLLSMEENTKAITDAVVVGGGLIGVEMAEMLLSRNINTTFLVREKNFWDIVLPKQESILIESHIKEHGVKLMLETELKQIISDERGFVQAVETSEAKRIPCQFVGLTVGVSPNISFLKSSDIETDKGILVNEFFETNIENVYAIGDCAQFINPVNSRKVIEQVWYTGRMHGETLANNLTAQKSAYNPGFWFNSAKFFDIEYQIYGNVPPMIPDSIESLYWEDTTQKICIRFVFDKINYRLIGLNSLGIRLRHQIADQWLNENKSVDFILDNLSSVFFDPELYLNYSSIISESLKSQLRTA